MAKKRLVRVELPPELEQLLTDYVKHCEESGLRKRSIELCEQVDRWFLEHLAETGCKSISQINARNIAAACLALRSNYYLSTVKTFLRVLAEMGKTDRDYSLIVPAWKRPQPMPTVYTDEEIRNFEKHVRKHSCKRNYAIILLATRLGIRSGDIAQLKPADIDFDAETIRVTQQKIEAENNLPMVPDVKAALRDYLDNSRPGCGSPYLFVRERPPFDDQPLTNVYIGNMVRRYLKESGAVINGRHTGPHSFRSSLASSMVNDGIPYDAVRKTLGHADPNTIRSYAKLDAERLKAYALAVPKAVGKFAKFLAGKAAL